MTLTELWHHAELMPEHTPTGAFTRDQCIALVRLASVCSRTGTAQMHTRHREELEAALENLRVACGEERI